ncbi:MAG: hypothetical protein RBR22_01370 [Desulfuromonas sp.]|nr:hypothetical protein [Desulfuromonas sp.]
MFKLRHNLACCWINLEYWIILPLISCLPSRVAFFLFKLRGIVQYKLDFEWKTYTLQTPFMRAQTQDVIRQLVPQADPKAIQQLVKNRFIHESWDEYLNYLLPRPEMVSILDQVQIESLSELKTVNENNPIVFVSIHYDAFCLGLTALGYHGLNMNVVNTQGIENKEIPSAVRGYYQSKYRNMERLMCGKMPYVEQSKKPFYVALNNGNCIGLMGDIPGNKSTVYIDFLGKSLRLPLGAWKFARETGAQLSAVVCIREKGHQYCVYTLSPYLPTEDPLESMRPIYKFLEKWIIDNPDRWTSSYLLQGY